MSSDTTTGDAPVQKPRRATPKWALPAVLAAAGLAVGVAAGIAIGLASDPVTESEYQALTSQYDDALARAEAAESSMARADERIGERAVAVSQRETAVRAAEQSIAAREQAVAAVEEQVAANSIGDGIWTVGVDVEPGTYRVQQALAGYCYWAIYRSGSSGGDIIENDGPTGGFPTVQLSEGQDFLNDGCGTFVKQ